MARLLLSLLASFSLNAHAEPLPPKDEPTPGSFMNCVLENPRNGKTQYMYFTVIPHGPSSASPTVALPIRMTWVYVNGRRVSFDTFQLSRVSEDEVLLHGDWYTLSTHPTVTVKLKAGTQAVDLYAEGREQDFFQCELSPDVFQPEFWTKVTQ